MHYSPLVLQKNVQQLIYQYPLVQSIIEKIGAAGGKALLVGGAVRDLVIGIAVKDLDIEVYVLSLDQLETILKQFGTVIQVGKAFGVLRVNNLDVDWSLPRKDAAGRKPDVEINPKFEFKEAFARRDLTMNAMGIDLITLELVDPFGGMSDIKNGILRSPDINLFEQDPLRLFRVMQFIARFEMVPDEVLTAVCCTMDIATVSRERIELEFEKVLLKSQKPSWAIRWLKSIGRLKEIMPELAALQDISQRPDFHPEGSVFEHAMQALDAAAFIAQKYEENNLKLILLYAALCHDLGKISTTVFVNSMWRSPGHAKAGVSLAKKLLQRIVGKADVIAAVCKLVEHHMAPGELVRSGARLSRYKRLAGILAPNVTMKMLADVAMADRRGRNGLKHNPLVCNDSEIVQFIKNTQDAGVFHAPEKPLVQGKDIIHLMKSGPQMGRLLGRAYEIQLEESITSKQELLKRIL